MTDSPSPSPMLTRRELVRDRILDVAERMFATQSFAAVSVRHITAEAEVNLAAINYYFGSKAGLLKAVFLRRATDLNRERLGRLQDLLAVYPSGPLPLDGVLRALVEPPLRWMFDPSRGLAVFIQFLARCQMEDEPEFKTLFYEDVEHLRRFIPALKRAAPSLSDSELYWCLHFVLGTLHYTFTHLERLRFISKGICNIDQPDEVVAQLIQFCVGGIETRADRG